MVYQNLTIAVNSTGFTAITKGAQPVTPSVQWLTGGMDGYKQMLVSRLLSWTPKRS